MENDILDLDGICKILNKKKQATRNSLKSKKIPGRKIMGDWYSSKMALSMFLAGYEPEKLYEKVAEKVINQSNDLMM